MWIYKKKRLFNINININLRVTLSLTDLLRVSDLVYFSAYLMTKMSIRFHKPCKSTILFLYHKKKGLSNKLSNKLSGVSKEYLVFINGIKSLNLIFLGVLSLLCIKFTTSIIPFTSPIILRIALPPEVWKRPILPNSDWINT
jgi:hypothetical protein